MQNLLYLGQGNHRNVKRISGCSKGAVCEADIHWLFTRVLGCPKGGIPATFIGIR